MTTRQTPWGRALRTALDRLTWSAARGAVDAVRYQPPHLKLLMACGASQPAAPGGVARWLADTTARPALREAGRLPHRAVRAVATRAATWFGPTASALVRFSSGATAATADRLGAAPLERWLGARAHPGLLVPHPHETVVLAADMRGFSQLTQALDDTQYLADLIEEYLTAMTGVIEAHRGVVFQYTGDGLLALFLPELAGRSPAETLDHVVRVVCPILLRDFDALHGRWLARWRDEARRSVPIGLGVGVSFGRVTLGFLGASGKKQFGALGEPLNLAALLCAEADADTVLVDRDSFTRAAIPPPRARPVRVRSRKLRRRVDALRLRAGIVPA